MISKPKTTHAGRMSTGLAVLLAALPLSLQAAPQPFAIPAGDAARTLRAFATQARLQLVFDQTLAERIRTPELSGEFEPRDALSILLENTGMTFAFVDARTIAIVRAAEAIPGARFIRTSLQVTPREAGSAPAADVTNSLALEEIVVSTRKIAEEIQDIPVAVSVLNTRALEEKGIEEMADVARYTAGLMYENGSFTGDTRPTIRGLNPVRGRPNVAILVDGVDQSSESIGVPGGGPLASFRFLDVCQVDVVRGPQSVLYGRSAFGGALSYTTCRPTEELTGSVKGQYGRFDTRELSGTVSGPMSDSLAFRLAGMYAESDGNYTNPNTGGDLNAYRTLQGSAALEWEPSDTFKAYARIQYAEDEASDVARILVSPVDIQTGQVIAENGGVCAPIPRLVGGVVESPPRRCYLTLQGNLDATPPARNRAIDLSPDPRTGKDFFGSRSDTSRAMLELTWDVGVGTFKSITGYIEQNNEISNDSDYGNQRSTTALLPVYAGVFGNPAGQPPFSLSGLYEPINDTRQVSEELQFTSELGSRVRLQSDLLYWKESATTQGRSQFWCREGSDPAFCTFVGSALGGNPAIPAVTAPVPADQVPGPAVTRRDSESWSLGVGFDIDITDSLVLGVGGRYFDETYDYTGYPYDTLPIRSFNRAVPTNLPTPQATVKSDEVVTNASLSWRLTDSNLLYVSYGEGFKPGGIDTTQQNGFVDLPTRAYDPEKLQAYELGSKNELLDRSLRINTALYFNRYTDQQAPVTTTFNGLPETSTVNIGESETYGAEVEIDWRALEGLDLGLRYAYTHAEFTDYFLPSAGASTRAESALAGGPFDGLSASATGKRVPRVPEHQLVTLARYEWNVGASGNRLWVGGDVQYVTKRYIDPYNNMYLPDYTLANAQLGFEADAWSLQFYVDNVFDDDKIKSAGTNSGFGFFDLRTNDLPRIAALHAPDPRMYGIRVAYRFGGTR